jgi:hypothetical protein
MGDKNKGFPRFLLFVWDTKKGEFCGMLNGDSLITQRKPRKKVRK